MFIYINVCLKETRYYQHFTNVLKNKNDLLMHRTVYQVEKKSVAFDQHSLLFMIRFKYTTYFSININSSGGTYVNRFSRYKVLYVYTF